MKIYRNWGRLNFLKTRGLFDSNMEKRPRAMQTVFSSLPARVHPNAAKQSRGEWGRAMRFLLRMAIWLGVVLVLLPSGGGNGPKGDVSASDALSAAKAAVTDMRSFCERQQEACSIGQQTAVALGHRAQAGAKMLYEFLNERLGPSETGTVVESGGLRSHTSQHTLTPADLAPTWRGPQPHREARTDRPV
jgi:hypothetical protein